MTNVSIRLGTRLGFRLGIKWRVEGKARMGLKPLPSRMESTEGTMKAIVARVDVVSKLIASDEYRVRVGIERGVGLGVMVGVGVRVRIRPRRR